MRVLLTAAIAAFLLGSGRALVSPRWSARAKEAHCHSLGPACRARPASSPSPAFALGGDGGDGGGGEPPFAGWGRGEGGGEDPGDGAAIMGNVAFMRLGSAKQNG